jgi:hypothetical protein
MAKIVTINSEISSVLREYNVNLSEAKLYLLAIYFRLDAEYVSEATKKQVNALGIVEREYKDNSSIPHTIRWKVPLFNEEKDEAFNWISSYQEQFGKLNPSRRGTKSAVMARMKKFFTEHPEIRKTDVKAATEAYLKTITDPQFLKSAHKFIYEGTGFNKVSMLEQYVEQIKVSGIEDGRSSKIRS